MFTKPVVGFLDMASNITAGIRETTTVFEAGDLNRERLPRYIGKDGIIIVSSSMNITEHLLNVFSLALLTTRSTWSNVVE